MENSIRDILPLDMPTLGYGTGTLLNDRRTRTAALRLVETARDSGVIYFDTARMYGAGRVEQVLGEMLARGRDKIILATKAGILPQSRKFHMRAIGLATRILRSAVPAVQPYVKVPAAAQPRFGAFELSDFRTSVETSLRALKTDYIDILLLHECLPADVEHPGLLEYLHHLKQEGKIRAFGLGAGIDQACDILAVHPELSDVVQVPNSIWDMNISRLPLGVVLSVTHSLLTARFHALRARLLADAAAAQSWLTATGIDPRDASGMVQLMLAHALRANPRGVSLFYSSKPDRIAANMRAIGQGRFDAAQLDALERLISRDDEMRSA